MSENNECYGVGCKGRERAQQHSNKSEALIECCPNCVGTSHRDPDLATEFDEAIKSWSDAFAAIEQMKGFGASDALQANVVIALEKRHSSLIGKNLSREAARVAGWSRGKRIGSREGLTIPSHHFEPAISS